MNGWIKSVGGLLRVLQATGYLVPEPASRTSLHRGRHFRSMTPAALRTSHLLVLY
jgi:hypothetical protein